jgi:hypothetical protein
LLDLLQLTGFAYESLNVLHRWAARFIIVSSAIHIGGRIHVRPVDVRRPLHKRQSTASDPCYRSQVNVPSSSPTAPASGYIGWGWAGQSSTAALSKSFVSDAGPCSFTAFACFLLYDAFL